MSQARDLWFENALLLAIAGLLGFIYLSFPAHTALAAGGGWDTNGVMAITSKNNSERLVLIDTSKQNICIYRTTGQSQFRLVGARSYKYDVEIKDSNGTAIERTPNGVTYTQIKQIYEASRKPSK